MPLGNVFGANFAVSPTTGLVPTTTITNGERNSYTTLKVLWYLTFRQLD